MPGRTYTEDDKITAYTVLNANGGNVRRTARDTGIPERTIRNWKEQWDNEGPDEAFMQKVDSENDDFIFMMEQVRFKALALLSQTMHEAKPNQLAVIFGIVDDKIRLAKGLATSRTESLVTALPPPEEMLKLYTGMVAGAIEAQNRREEEIVDAEIVEQAPKALTSGT